MKKSIAHASALLFSLFAFTACSDDGIPDAGDEFTDYSYRYGDFLREDKIAVLDTYEKYQHFCSEENTELDEYLAEWTFEPTCASTYFTKLNSYKASYFEKSILLVVHTQQPSGSIQLSVQQLSYSDSVAQIMISRLIPGICTDDMCGWSFILETAKPDFDITSCTVIYTHN